ncbi:MAG: DUF455 family protein, partial [Sphingomonadales bacterium]
LSRIFKDEIRHVRAGTKWFESACAAANLAPEAAWQALVIRHYKGMLKPPFNDSARDSAGLSRESYEALAAG